MNKKFQLISRETQILDVINHEAFKNRGKLIFPWDDMTRYSRGMTMENAPTLHLWHSNMDVNQMVAGVNRLIIDRSYGLEVLLDYYSDSEKETDSSKQDTGMFFFRGEPDAPFVVIVPGGGYQYVGSLHEGFPVAMEFNKRGYNAFILNYRVNQGSGNSSKVAGNDLIQAVNYIKENYKQLKVNPKNYALWGGSAGANACSNVTYGEAGFSRNLSPAVNILAYSAFTGRPVFSKKDVPAYIIGGTKDWIVPIEAIHTRVADMRKVGIDVEMQIIDIEHGFAVGKGTKAEGWLEKAMDFWEKHRK